jgi:hypothetical protein
MSLGYSDNLVGDNSNNNGTIAIVAINGLTMITTGGANPSYTLKLGGGLIYDTEIYASNSDILRLLSLQFQMRDSTEIDIDRSSHLKNSYYIGIDGSEENNRYYHPFSVINDGVRESSTLHYSVYNPNEGTGEGGISLLIGKGGRYEATSVSSIQYDIFFNKEQNNTFFSRAGNMGFEWLYGDGFNDNHCFALYTNGDSETGALLKFSGDFEAQAISTDDSTNLWRFNGKTFPTPSPFSPQLQLLHYISVEINGIEYKLATFQ